MAHPVHNQTEFRVDSGAVEWVCEWVRERVEGIPERVSVAFVGDDPMQRLHEQYYGERGTTDVLAFPYEDNTAEVVLNPDQHRRQAKQQNHTLNREVVENLIHALLHLAGYDHTGAGDGGAHLRRQKALLEEMGGQRVPLIIDADSARSTGS